MSVRPPVWKSAFASAASTAFALAIAFTATITPGASAATAPSTDVPTMAPQPTRTLFLTERFTPSSIRGPLTDASVSPESMHTLLGEREGFQVALNNTTPGTLALDARIVPDARLGAALSGGTIAAELLRSSFVNVPAPSLRVESSRVPGAYAAGTYEDPLPPLRSDSAAGLLHIGSGAWGAVIPLFAVRTTASAGVYGGTVEVFDPQTNTIYAQQPFTLTAHNMQLRQPGAANSFKTVLDAEGDQYWFGDPAMRNGRAAGFATAADRMLQLQGLMSFLDSRNVMSPELPFGEPSASGGYTCSAASGTGTFSFLDQLKNRYFAPQRDIAPGTSQFPARMAPSITSGCDYANPAGGFTGKVDFRHTPGIKQDDNLNAGAARSFYSSVASAWSSNGLYGIATYVRSPFDEPSDATPNMKQQYLTQVPLANKLLHGAFGTRAKVVLADWPRDNANRKVCRPGAKPGQKSCTVLSGDGFSNKYMWDGKRGDDIDVWLAPFSRLFGRPLPPIVTKYYKVNRDREYADRFAKIKKLRGGREVWAYNFWSGNAQQPQLTIDAPSTDPRMNDWILAREGHTGLFVSNLMLGWGASRSTNPDGTVRKSNPYTETPYYWTPWYGRSAGWGTFIYPPYSAALGLTREDDRNSANTRPVTSLRMEGLRDGNEDANLILMYRDRFGAAATNNILKPVLPGAYRPLPKKLGQVVFPVYDNGNNLAQRMERQRRAIIAQLAP